MSFSLFYCSSDLLLCAIAGAIKQGIANLNVFMAVIGALESALHGCQKCIEGQWDCIAPHVQSWDAAVAFYAGSLEGQEGSGTGVMLYGSADRRCRNFNTCGTNEQDAGIEGTSWVNNLVMGQFQLGQHKLVRAQCSEAEVHKEYIVRLMKIPLIQGTLRYAFLQSGEAQGDKTAQVEGATYAAGILPYIHACNPQDAETIHLNMQVGSDARVDFEAVKGAFEGNYACLGLNCDEIGGLYDFVAKDYFPNARPCVAQRSSTRIKKGRANPKLAIGLSVGGVLLMLLIVVVAGRCGPKAAPAETERKSDGEVS